MSLLIIFTENNVKNKKLLRKNMIIYGFFSSNYTKEKSDSFRERKL